jgi:hypothetical protein
MRELTQRIVRDVMPDSAKNFGFTKFNLENVVTLVARPETLLPVRLSVTKTITGSAKAEGQTGTLHQVDVTTQTYTYEKRD